MRKLAESTLVSLDGVVGSPWAWTGQLSDGESRRHALAALDRYKAFVFGRVTYETFAATWSQVKGDVYLDRINAMPKFVASTTLHQTTWNATLLEGDVVEAIRRLKQEPGKDLIKYGTGKLDQTLVEHRLPANSEMDSDVSTLGSLRAHPTTERCLARLSRETRFGSRKVMGAHQEDNRDGERQQPDNSDPRDLSHCGHPASATNRSNLITAGQNVGGDSRRARARQGASRTPLVTEL